MRGGVDPVHVGAVVPDAIELAEQRRVPVGPALQVDVVEVGVERLGWGCTLVAMVMRSSMHQLECAVASCTMVFEGITDEGITE